MHLPPDRDLQLQPPSTQHLSKRWRAGLAVLASFAALGGSVAMAQQSPQPQDSSSASQPGPRIYDQAAAIHVPDANDRMLMDQQAKQSKEAKFEVADAARRKQIADDAAKLLELATQLKAAVDKTDKDTLSLDVIRKADTIERLAKGVKEKMKLTVGAS